MTKNKKKFDFKRLKEFLPYIVTGVLTLGIVFFGSLDKRNGDATLSLDAFAASDYNISIDQLSELYVVADLSNALRLASATDVATNYVTISTMYENGQTTTGKIEKPSLTDLTASRGVVEYVVANGETMESIAEKYGISTDQIRWSNGLKTTAVSEGTTLYIPSTSGIVHQVKDGETISSIVEKYGGNEAEIVALNDLEVSGISEGMRILIKGGSLPEKERPEYVAPVVRTYTYTYTYLGDTSERQNIEVIYQRFYGAGGGQCVHWAYYMRPDLHELYGWSLGNANTWAARATKSTVDRTPAAGAIFQTSSGWYGHVGYVESVNADGSITVTEMNYGYVAYRVIRSTIPADKVGNFNYIH